MRDRLVAALLLSLVLPLRSHAEKDWPAYGNDSGGMRYSTLKQINPNNVAQLRRVWEFHTGDTSGLMEAPPIVINNVMYVSAANGVFALEA